MSHETKGPDEHRIHWTLTRSEWLATEWPAVVVWGGWGLMLLLLVLTGATFSRWWLLLLPVWWVAGGAKATGIALFLVRGREREELVVRRDGTLWLASNGGEALFAHWVAFVNQGPTFLLWGADGRYRLVLPRRALAAEDYAAIERATGVDLVGLAAGAEKRIDRSTGTDLASCGLPGGRRAPTERGRPRRCSGHVGS